MIGLGAALFTGQSDIAGIMAKAGLGVAALIILILSTVTTTFLDAWSAGISAESLDGRLSGKGKTIAAVVTVIGTLGAALFNMDDITGFLYLIGSVFAPMIAIQIADFFILKKNHDHLGHRLCPLPFPDDNRSAPRQYPAGHASDDPALSDCTENRRTQKILYCFLASFVKPSTGKHRSVEKRLQFETTDLLRPV